MADNGPVEPSADLRQFARTNYEMFVALQNEGFTEKQALVIIGQFIAAAIGGMSDD